MDDETLILLAVGGVVAYISYKNLFEPQGIETPQALSNVTERTGTSSYRSVANDRTYIQAGNTTYTIRDSELSQTGFIRRRAMIPAALNSVEITPPNWLQQWVYS